MLASKPRYLGKFQPAPGFGDVLRGQVVGLMVGSGAWGLRSTFLGDGRMMQPPPRDGKLTEAVAHLSLGEPTVSE